MHARSECSTGWKFCRPIQGRRQCLFSLSPPFVPLPSFSSSIFSPLCPCLPSPFLFLTPPIILATPSYIIYPREFIIQQRPLGPQQTNTGWSETQCLTTASAPPKVFKQCWHLEQTVTSVLIQPKIIRRRFAIKIKPLLCDIINSSL